MTRHKPLPLSVIAMYEPLARKLGVSRVARSSKGFLTAYKRAGGRLSSMTEAWRRKREAFIARHKAQALANDEPLWIDGLPTRRHLAMIMWAWSPRPKDLRARAKHAVGRQKP